MNAHNITAKKKIFVVTLCHMGSSLPMWGILSFFQIILFDLGKLYLFSVAIKLFYANVAA